MIKVYISLPVVTRYLLLFALIRFRTYYIGTQKKKQIID